MSAQRKQEAITALREILKPGDMVYTVLRHVARSGMTRWIDCYVMQDNAPRWISRRVADATGMTFDDKRESIKVGGCGMDMGFHVVYNLSRALYNGAFTCIGKDCPSNDHSNVYYHAKQGECIVCQKPVGESKETRANGEGGRVYPVCSFQCADGTWRHSDGGYALRQRWQ